jgi:hypothetical protein
VGDVDGVTMTAVGDIVGTVMDTVAVTDEATKEDSMLKRRNDCDCTPFTLPIPYNPRVATIVVPPPTIAMTVADGRRRSFISMDALIIVFPLWGLLRRTLFCTHMKSCHVSVIFYHVSLLILYIFNSYKQQLFFSQFWCILYNQYRDWIIIPHNNIIID